jgi:broad specificity phosphatase PhoE
VRLFAIARHGQSTLNLERRVNGDPARPAPLTDEGRRQAELLGRQLAHVPLEALVHTRFARTLETGLVALGGRDVPASTEPLLDDVDVGELDGLSLAEYREVKRGLRRDEPFPGGESLDDAARRYAAAYRGLLGRAERTLLVVCHEIPLRYALNAATGSDSLDGPIHDIANATPYLFDEVALARAVERIEQLSGRPETAGR